MLYIHCIYYIYTVYSVLLSLDGLTEEARFPLPFALKHLSRVSRFMDAWRELGKSLVFEFVRWGLSFSGDQWKGGHCKKAEIETTSCLDSLQRCLAAHWELRAQLVNQSALEGALDLCQRTEVAPLAGSIGFWVGLSFLLFLSGVLFGLSVNTGVRRPLVAPRRPLSRLEQAGAKKPVEKKVQDEFGEPSSTGSSVDRARARARTLRG